MSATTRCPRVGRRRGEVAASGTRSALRAGRATRWPTADVARGPDRERVDSPPSPAGKAIADTVGRRRRRRDRPVRKGESGSRACRWAQSRSHRSSSRSCPCSLSRSHGVSPQCRSGIARRGRRTRTTRRSTAAPAGDIGSRRTRRRGKKDSRTVWRGGVGAWVFFWGRVFAVYQKRTDVRNEHCGVKASWCDCPAGSLWAASFLPCCALRLPPEKPGYPTCAGLWPQRRARRDQRVRPRPPARARARPPGIGASDKAVVRSDRIGARDPERGAFSWEGPRRAQSVRQIAFPIRQCFLQLDKTCWFTDNGNRKRPIKRPRSRPGVIRSWTTRE